MQVINGFSRKNTTICLPNNPFPIVVNERGSRRIRICSQRRPYLLPKTTVSAPRDDRACSQIRTRLGADSPKIIVFNMGESLL